MNVTLYMIITFLTSVVNQTEKVTIDFNHGTVILNGGSTELIIKGHDEQFVDVMTSNGRALSKDEYKIKRDKLTIDIPHAYESVTILLPQQVNLECALDQVYYETENSELRDVRIEGVGGEVEFNADGYNVYVKNTGSHVSIVTYGNIEAWFEDFNKGTVISLDTYLGNIVTHISDRTEANLNLTAMGGKVNMEQFNVTKRLRISENNFIGQINDGGVDIILHSEAGELVELKKY